MHQPVITEKEQKEIRTALEIGDALRMQKRYKEAIAHFTQSISFEIDKKN